MVIRKRGPQRYEIVVYVGTDDHGKEIRQSRMFRGTLKDARTREGEMLRDSRLNRGKTTGQTFTELATRWQRAAGHEASTAYQTRHYLDRHILPAIGHRKLTDITRETLRSFYAGLELAPTTVARIHGIVRAALQYGMHDLEWIGENPAVGVKLPKGGRKEPVVPSVESVTSTLAFLREKHPDLWVFVRLAAATGARRGEVVAFRWSDFSDGHRVAYKQRAIGLARGGGYVKATKTGTVSGIRLDTRTAAVVRWHRWRMSVRARSAGISLPLDGYLFSDRVDGDVPWRPDAPTKRLAIYRTNGYCDTVQLRTLRHFVATQLIASGTDVRTVANRLGHARTSTTMDIYAAALNEADQAAADTMGKVLG